MRNMDPHSSGNLTVVGATVALLAKFIDPWEPPNQMTWWGQSMARPGSWSLRAWGQTQRATPDPVCWMQLEHRVSPQLDAVCNVKLGALDQADVWGQSFVRLRPGTAPDLAHCIRPGTSDQASTQCQSMGTIQLGSATRICVGLAAGSELPRHCYSITYVNYMIETFFLQAAKTVNVVNSLNVVKFVSLCWIFRSW